MPLRASLPTHDATETTVLGVDPPSNIRLAELVVYFRFFLQVSKSFGLLAIIYYRKSLWSQIDHWTHMTCIKSVLLFKLEIVTVTVA